MMMNPNINPAVPATLPRRQWLQALTISSAGLKMRLDP